MPRQGPAAPEMKCGLRRERRGVTQWRPQMALWPGRKMENRLGRGSWRTRAEAIALSADEELIRAEAE